MGQRLGHLDADPGRLAVVEPSRRMPGPVRGARAGALPQHGVEATPGDVLHDVEVSPPGFAHAEDGDDVGVVQPAGGPGLASKPGEVPVLRQDLQRHVPVERALRCLPNDPHAATAQLADNPELTPGLDRRWSGGQVTRTGRLGIRLRLRLRTLIGVQTRIGEPSQLGHDRVGLRIEPAGLLLARRAGVEMLGHRAELGLREFPQRKGGQGLETRAGGPAHRTGPSSCRSPPALRSPRDGCKSDSVATIVNVVA
jgi:hypothetical protein